MQASNPTPNTQRNLDYDMMVPPGSTPSPSSDIATPITMAMIGIVSIAITLTLYHLLVLKFCAQRDAPASHLHEILSGVDQKVLNSIPIQAYSHKQRASGASDQCAVCLGEFEEGDPVRLLPDCHHLFHLQCIDAWFASHSSCPICRSSVVAPPTSPVLPVIIDVDAAGSLPQQSLNHQGSIVIFVEEDDSVPAHSRKIISSAASSSLCVERKPQTRFLPPLLKRSLSDCSFVSAKTCNLQHEYGPTSLKVESMRCSS